MSYETPDDDVFTSFIKSRKEKEEQRKKEADERKQRFENNKQDFDPIKFCAAPAGGYAVVRFIGSLPKEETDPNKGYTSVERNLAKVKDDKGAEMYLYLPTREQNPDHIMWKIIDTVNHKEWKNGTATFPVQTEHPEIWAIIKKGGYKPEDDKPGSKFKPYGWASGWAGKQTFFGNCIDRLDDWCKENKHTKIFSKNVTRKEYDDQENPGQKVVREYADRGISSAGFLEPMYDLSYKYKLSWDKFDTYVIRTGQKSPAYKLQNASKQKEKNDIVELEGISEKDWERVSTAPGLTEEEKNYETYNIQKLFAVTSYNKILSRLGNQIRTIDAALNTNFAAELTSLAEAEKAEKDREAEMKKEFEAQEAAKTEAPAESAPVAEEKPAEAPSFDTMKEVEAPARRRMTTDPVASDTKPGLTPEKIALLKGYEKLTDEEKSLILDVIVEDGKLKDIVYADSVKSTLMACETDDGKGCGYMSPSSFHYCPACGAKYM